MKWKSGGGNLARRLEALEARLAPAAEAVTVEIAYMSPDGTEEVDCTVEIATSTGPAWLRRLRGTV
jgi:hypothetical protein